MGGDTDSTPSNVGVVEHTIPRQALPAIFTPTAAGSMSCTSIPEFQVVCVDRVRWPRGESLSAVVIRYGNAKEKEEGGGGGRNATSVRALRVEWQEQAHCLKWLQGSCRIGARRRTRHRPLDTADLNSPGVGRRAGSAPAIARRGWISGTQMDTASAAVDTTRVCRLSHHRSPAS